MTNIDFLPAEYRRRTDDRRNRAWRLSVLVVFGLSIALTAFYQHSLRRQANRDLAEVEVLYELAIARSNHLNESHVRLRKRRGTADLYTLLDHPWSRTQILQAVFQALPDEATLSELRISRVAPPTRAVAQRTFSTQKNDEEKALAHLFPDERDQKLLREKLNATQTVVVLTGTTHDQRAIHDYIALLEQNDLFIKVEITSIEQTRSENNAKTLFGARLVVRPAYGLSGGPTGAKRIEDRGLGIEDRGSGSEDRGPQFAHKASLVPRSSLLDPHSASTTSSHTEINR